MSNYLSKIVVFQKNSNSCNKSDGSQSGNCSQGFSGDQKCQITCVKPSFISKFAKSVDHPKAEAIFISCGALRTLDVIEEIENQYTFAKANGHTNSAIKALELLSRIRGAKNDKEVDLSKEGLRANIVDALKILGKKNVMELIKECEFT